MKLDLKLVAILTLSITLARVTYDPTAFAVVAFLCACALTVSLEFLKRIEDERISALRSDMASQLEVLRGKVDQILMRGGR